MVRAAIDGRIDFTKADPADPMWHLRLVTVIRELAERDRLEQVQITHSRYLSLMNIVSRNETQLNKYAEKEFEYFEKYQHMLFGIESDTEDRKKTMAKRLKEAWSKAFGDANDPAVQKKIDNVANSLKNMRTPTGRTK